MKREFPTQPKVDRGVKSYGAKPLAHRDAYNDAARNAGHYAEDAKKDIAAKCAGLAGQARDDCADEIDNAAREDQRNEYDLAAQQISAMWAAVMGGMAVVGVSLSAVGVYLIWQTWGETRAAALAGFKANEIARDQYRMGLKPWLLVDVEPIPLDNQEITTAGLDKEPRTVGVRAKFTVTNIGEHATAIIYAQANVFVLEQYGRFASPIYYVLPKGREVMLSFAGGGVIVGHDQTALMILRLTVETRRDYWSNLPPIWGMLRYTDALGAIYELGFGFKITSLHGPRAERWGGEEKNYDRLVKERA